MAFVIVFDAIITLTTLIPAFIAGPVLGSRQAGVIGTAWGLVVAVSLSVLTFRLWFSPFIILLAFIGSLEMTSRLAKIDDLLSVLSLPDIRR